MNRLFKTSRIFPIRPLESFLYALASASASNVSSLPRLNLVLSMCWSSSVDRSRCLFLMLTVSRSQKLWTSRRYWIFNEDSGLHVQPTICLF